MLFDFRNFDFQSWTLSLLTAIPKMVWFLASKESRHERTNQSLPGSSEALAAKDGSKLLVARCLILFLGSFIQPPATFELTMQPLFQGLNKDFCAPASFSLTRAPISVMGQPMPRNTNGGFGRNNYFQACATNGVPGLGVCDWMELLDFAASMLDFLVEETAFQGWTTGWWVAALAVSNGCPNMFQPTLPQFLCACQIYGPTQPWTAIQVHRR